MKPGLLATTIASVALASAAICYQHKGASNPEKIIEVTLDRTVCYGTCPEYTLSFKAVKDGQYAASYQGRRWARREGSYKGDAYAWQMDYLLGCLNKLDIWSLKDEYRQPITDQPTYTITVKTNRRTKKILSYGESPAEVWGAMALVDQMGDLQWKKVSDKAKPQG